MPNVSDLYSLWLKPWHLPPDKGVNVTIAAATVQTLHPRPTEERQAIVLSFVGKNRRLILNDGNANRMADLGGEDTDGWKGLVIQIKRQKFTKDKETIVILPAAERPAKPEPANDQIKPLDLYAPAEAAPESVTA